LAVVQDSVSAGAESFNCLHLQVEESSQRRDGFSPIYKKAFLSASANMFASIWPKPWKVLLIMFG